MILERIYADVWELEAYAGTKCGLGGILEARKRHLAMNQHLVWQCAPPEYFTSDLVPFLLYKQASPHRRLNLKTTCNI
jgi:hypothetical protein